MQYDKGEWQPRPVDYLFPKMAGAKAMAIEMKVCVHCAGEAEFFNDLESQLDYGITGLCQSCQDKVYVDPEDMPRG